jgi:hypothetical protein
LYSFPQDAFDFSVYEAVLRFYAGIFSGYRKFLFFVQDTPFFNTEGFLSWRCPTESPDLPF